MVTSDVIEVAIDCAEITVFGRSVVRVDNGGPPSRAEVIHPGLTSVPGAQQIGLKFSTRMPMSGLCDETSNTEDL